MRTLRSDVSAGFPGGSYQTAAPMRRRFASCSLTLDLSGLFRSNFRGMRISDTHLHTRSAALTALARNGLGGRGKQEA